MEKNKLIWQLSIKNMFNIVNYDLILTKNNIEDWKIEFNRLIGIRLNIKDGIMGDGNPYTNCLFDKYWLEMYNGKTVENAVSMEIFECSE